MAKGLFYEDPDQNAQSSSVDPYKIVSNTQIYEQQQIIQPGK